MCLRRRSNWACLRIHVLVPLRLWMDDPTNAGFHLRFLPVLSMDGNFTWLGGCIDACGCVCFVVVCTSLLSCLFLVFASVSFPVRIRPRLAPVPRSDPMSSHHHRPRGDLQQQRVVAFAMSRRMPSYKQDVHARASRSNRSNQTKDGPSRSKPVNGTE